MEIDYPISDASIPSSSKIAETSSNIVYCCGRVYPKMPAGNSSISILDCHREMESILAPFKSRLAFGLALTSKMW